MKMKMETTQPHPTAHPLSSSISPLKQHPILATIPSPSDATKTIFLNHPSARLSSSPASSPHIVDPPPRRRGSVYPAMERGLLPGADFFDDGSSDSEWEDTEGEVTQTFTASHDLGLRSFVHGFDEKDGKTARGRSRNPSTATVLPPCQKSTAHETGLGINYGQRDGGEPSCLTGDKSPERAKQMSMQRLNKDKVRLVDNRSSTDTPRESLQSNNSDAAFSVAGLEKTVPFPNLAPLSPSFQGRNRTNTSESMLADSVFNAHAMTMRALESLGISPKTSISPPQGHTYLHSATSAEFAKSASFSASRQLTISPSSTPDSDRPAHLPPHFVKTPYPFTARKEFPKPRSRPRQRDKHPRLEGREAEDYARLDSGYGDEGVNNAHNDSKGKHVLGLSTSEGEYDLRSRLERNQSAQGIVRSHVGSKRECTESVVWLSLVRETRKKEHTNTKLVRINIPSNLTANDEKRTSIHKQVDFDDAYLAHRIRAAHRELAGSWFRRAFSARKLRCIQLGQVSMWSGTPLSLSSSTATSGLLATGEGTLSPSDTRSPFTEQDLMALFKKPKAGTARYSWVHWARRVAASNHSQTEDKSLYAFTWPKDSVTTVRFVHALSTFRVLVALTIMHLLSVAAALLWIFLGVVWKTEINGQKSERVGTGMAIGVLTLLLEGVGFGAWIALS